MNPIHNLAVKFYETLQPDAPLSAIERRIWMLKCRNIRNETVFQILKEEYAPNASVPQPSEQTDIPIIVESLPDKYTRNNWQ